MNRITEKDLAGMVARLNRLTKSPLEYMTDRKINVGHYHIDYAYGGVELCRTANESGGVNNVLGCGHVSKRDCYEKTHAYIRGIEDAQEVERT